MFFDLQINGFAGVDFNRDDLTAEELHRACLALQNSGVRGFLATIISEEIPVMARRLATLAALRERDELAQKLIFGFHLEGPFLSDLPGFVGAHPREVQRPANGSDAERLLDAAQGLVKLVTLAPERDKGFAVTRQLSERGIAVAAGHSDASLETLRGALDNGLKLFTHLGNGCPASLARHDNVVQRALSLENLQITFIADGAHIPFFALKNYLRLAGIERCSLVSDAIAPAGLGPGHYTLGRWQLQIGDDMVARAPDGSHLVGSALTMAQGAQNLQRHVGLSAAQVRAMTWENPRRLLNLD